MINMTGIMRSFMLGGVELPVLRGLDLAVEEGDFLSILGSSGCGKSTLLNILGLLDRPTAGEYLLEGEPVADLSDRDLSALRNRKIGFVFQSFNLLSRLSAVENVEMPLVYRNLGKAQRHRRSMDLLKKVGLADRADHRPAQLSGGQQQRVAIARALVGEPVVLLADEPTGALDSTVGREIMDLFLRLNSEGGLTILMITHDVSLSQLATSRLRMVDGLLYPAESAEAA